MTQLEEIQKLYAKPREYKIPAKLKEGQSQATIKITPLRLDEMDSLNMDMNASMSDISANVHKLIAKSLGVEEGSIKGISFEFLNEIMDAIMDANNFNEEDLKKTGIKSFIEKKKALLVEKKAEDDAKPNIKT